MESGSYKDELPALACFLGNDFTPNLFSFRPKKKREESMKEFLELKTHRRERDISMQWRKISLEEGRPHTC
jgi:hypothetical protein